MLVPSLEEGARDCGAGVQASGGLHDECSDDGASKHGARAAHGKDLEQTHARDAVARGASPGDPGAKEHEEATAKGKACVNWWSGLLS